MISVFSGSLTTASASQTRHRRRTVATTSFMLDRIRTSRSVGCAACLAFRAAEPSSRDALCRAVPSMLERSCMAVAWRRCLSAQVAMAESLSNQMV
jgi:hypothetical protein